MTTGLIGRIAIDLASGHVVQIPYAESSTTQHVNRDLDSFSRCIAAVIARFPFYAEGDEERCEEVAKELRELVFGIDGSALAPNGFWETSATTWRSGTTPTVMRDPEPIARFGQPSWLRPVAAMRPATRSGR
ncbi:SUKH-4 family immunity protein [Streptomyces hydrogenans]|uniref:SUKH-4 family immunity protein n=1 Tax=Streptomyces hydrogenans TaxID=1873719 RepID=UPI00332389AB